MKRPPFFFRTAMRQRGRNLMKRWQRLVEEFGDGDHALAERTYPRLVTYRKRALRLARKLKAMNNPQPA